MSGWVWLGSLAAIFVMLGGHVAWVQVMSR
jgi:hypothetical protein